MTVDYVDSKRFMCNDVVKVTLRVTHTKVIDSVAVCSGTAVFVPYHDLYIQRVLELVFSSGPRA